MWIKTEIKSRKSKFLKWKTQVDNFFLRFRIVFFFEEKKFMQNVNGWIGLFQWRWYEHTKISSYSAKFAQNSLHLLMWNNVSSTHNTHFMYFDVAFAHLQSYSFLLCKKYCNTKTHASNYDDNKKIKWRRRGSPIRTENVESEKKIELVRIGERMKWKTSECAPRRILFR